MKIKSGVRIGWPDGSYSQTCDDISYNENSAFLQAYCQQMNGNYKSTSIYLPEDYNDIANCDGQLTLDTCS